MRKSAFLALLITLPMLAQVSNPSVIYTASAPSGACSNAPPIRISGGVLYLCDNGTWQGIGTGGGSVVSFTAGNLSPLFTTSVATGTTTPALSFTLSSAAQNSVFAGPASGGSGLPSFQIAPTFSAANLTNFPTLNQNTTGQAATAINISTSGTANQVWGMNSGGSAQGWQTVSGGGTPGGTSGQVQYNNAGAFGGFTFSGDFTLTPSTGVGVVGGIGGVPLCSGFTPTNGQALEYTTGSSPNPCYTAVTGAGGSGTVQSGTGYALPAYSSGASTTVGPSNITTDSTGNNLIVPGAASFGSGGTTQLTYKPTTIADLPSASGSTCGGNPGTTSCNGFYIPVNDATVAGSCAAGGGSILQWCYSNGTSWLGTVPAGSVTTVSVTPANGVSGSVTNPTTTPALAFTLGAITPSSSVATGIADGQTASQVVTATTFNFGSSYSLGYYDCENATAAAACTGTLPAAVAGKTYCIDNANNGSAPNTGVLTIQTSGTGQYIIYSDGTLSASGGYVSSGGAARDSGCVRGVDATHWMFYPGGTTTWTKH